MPRAICSPLFDGIQETPEGLDDVSKFPDLVAELLRMGVKDEDASKVVGGNILRVWAAVEEVAEKMKEEREGEDDIKLTWQDAVDQV